MATRPFRFSFRLAGLVAVASGVVGFPVPAKADDCRERFTRFLAGTLDGPPGQARIVTLQGGQATEAEFLFASHDHSLYRGLKPAGQPWCLTWNGARWRSSDQGRSWTKSAEFDRDAQRRQQLEGLRAQAAGARDLACGREEFDGRPHDTYVANIGMPGAPGMVTLNRYWVDPATGIATRTVMTNRIGIVESVTTQDWKPLGGVTLPTP